MADLTRWDIQNSGMVTLFFSDHSMKAARLNCCPECTETINRYPEVMRAALAHRPPRTLTRREQETAEEKARALLVSLLPEKAQRQLKRSNYFTFTSQLGHTYHMRVGYSGNVVRLNSLGQAMRQYCCHLFESHPVYDHMIAQYLCLKYNEKHFLERTF